MSPRTLITKENVQKLSRIGFEWDHASQKDDGEGRRPPRGPHRSAHRLQPLPSGRLPPRAPTVRAERLPQLPRRKPPAPRRRQGYGGYPQSQGYGYGPPQGGYGYGGYQQQGGYGGYQQNNYGGGGGNNYGGDRGGRVPGAPIGVNPFKGGAGGNTSLMPGDWICEVCENNNFARRRECRRCGAPRST